MLDIWDRFTTILRRDGKRRTTSERPTIRLQLEQLEQREVLNAASANILFVESTVNAEMRQAAPIIANMLNNLSSQYQQFVVQVTDRFFPGLESATQAAFSTSQTGTTAVHPNAPFNVNGQALNSLPANP